VKYETLLELLEDNRVLDKGITFINGDENDNFMCYGRVYNEALIVLYNLQLIGIKPGQELIFQIERNEDFIVLFWACILGGIIPVPVTIGVNEEHRIKLLRILNILNDPFIITDKKIFEKLSAYLNKKGLNEEYEKVRNRTIFVEDVKKNKGIGTVHRAHKYDIAFIQFSSGSTGDPKGVVLTHENLLINIKDIICGAEITDDDSSFGWMPLTHDLGLIGFHLSPMFAGINQYIMPTPFFVTQPIKWLEKTNQYRISILASPNFGYRHFLNFYDSDVSRDWDFSCVRLIINGAEPISSDLNKEFHDKMLKWGLKKNVTLPVYGMAEACVGVSFSRPGDGLIPVPVDRNYMSIGSTIKEMDNIEDKDTLVFVDLGYPLQECNVRICDDKDKVLGERTIGNIEICGKNVTSGYYNNPKAYSEAITADGWLKTGDLGFIRNGRLVMTGRKKDIIFVNGQNYYPHDLERIVEEIQEMSTGRVAFCGVYNKELQKEEIAVFVLHKRSLKEFCTLAAKIKNHINKQIGLEIGVVIPVKKMPKTTSGKIQRYMLKELYEAGEYSGVLTDLQACMSEQLEKRILEVPKDEIEKRILEIWISVLHKESISTDDNFFEIGGNSIKAAYIINDIYKELGVVLPVKDIFEEPTIKALADYVKNGTSAKYESIEKIDEASCYEVSSAQKRIFALSQVENNTGYNISLAIRIKGEIDKEKFENTFKEAVKRNESLRTYFTVSDGLPVQKVIDEADFQVKFQKAYENELQDTIASFIRPFDLQKPPLFRVCLIEITEKTFVLVLDMHHIISDGTSVTILLEQLFDIYEGKKLKEPKIQYKDFAAWQNKNLKSKQLEKSELYWLNEFKGEIPVLDLPFDYTRPAYHSFEGDKLFFELDKEVTRKLKVLAGKYKASLFMLLLSAYYVLLKKYSNQEDIVIGTSSAGRIHPDTNGLIGMLVNTLPLRNYPEGKKGFHEFFKNVRDNTLEAYENQDYQFEMLIEKLDVKRNMSRNPLFDTMFVMQNMITSGLRRENHKLDIYPISNKTSKFDLTFFASETDDKICFEIEYCTGLFRENTIGKLWSHYSNILIEVLENPEIRISDIRMLSKEEITKFIYTYNDTVHDYPADQTIIELIEKQSEKTPDNIAVLFKDRQLTYRELKYRYSRFARVLRDKGLGRNDIAAIAADRSIEVVIAMLAVLKAGGAYLPIDPNYPSERINYMLADSKAKLLLTDIQYAGGWIFEGEIIDICDEKLYEGKPELIKSDSMPEDLAYVIYTSGSTGKPKGVMLEHRNLTNYAFWASKSYIMGERLNFPLYTSIAFDLTITSIYTSLITGNSIVIYSGSDDEPLISKVTRDNNVGIVKATPAHLMLIKNNDNTGSSVRRLIVGGEQLDTELAGKIQESFGNSIEIYNEYGPTETTVGCMLYKYNKEKDTGVNVPIGIPADNVQIYILDRDMRVVPENVPGEMYVSGDGVSRGYLGRIELTGSRFIENPFCAGKKMYKTGDLAKWLSDGNIEFIGRIDSQVKIKGFRVELGEIENQLLTHTCIEQAVVVDREDGNGDKYLAAYLETNGDISDEKLRNYLIKELPEYMIPSYFVKLNKIPLTINGKVDKRALPEPKDIVFLDKEYIAPSNEKEELFEGIWADVLGFSKVGVTDNYFSLGGDSIKAIQIASRLNQAGIDISVSNILTYQTIRECCRNCTFGFNEKKYAQGIIEGEFGLTPIVKWFIGLELKNPDYYNQSVLLKCKERIDVLKLEQSLAKIIEHHDGLRLNYDSVRGELFVNNNHLKDKFKIEVFDISSLSITDQALELEKIGVGLKAGFDIENTLLIKGALINAGENGQYVMLTAHHIVVDGVSWRIIFEDLYNLYTALKSEDAIYLPPKTASIKDWYDSLVSYSNDMDIMEHSEYWNEVPANEFELPTEYKTSDWSYENKSVIRFELSKDDTYKLLKESRNAYNTDVQDLLLIALAKTLKEWTGKEEIVIELEGHGRNIPDIDLSRTVGWFTSIYPIKIIVKEDTLSNQIKSIKEQLRSIPNNGIDYGILKYMKQVIEHKDIGRVPVRFNYLGQLGNEADNELFSYANYGTGEDVCCSNDITASIDINCIVIKDVLGFEVSFNKNEFKEETVKGFSHNYVKNLEYLIDHVSNQDEVFFTPSDFETVKINQEDLDMLFD